MLLMLLLFCCCCCCCLLCVVWSESRPLKKEGKEEGCLLLQAVKMRCLHLLSGVVMRKSPFYCLAVLLWGHLGLGLPLTSRS